MSALASLTMKKTGNVFSMVSITSLRLVDSEVVVPQTRKMGFGRLGTVDDGG